MLLNKYYAILTKLIEDNPQALDMEVITSSDDEGNSYTPVIYEPCLGHYGADDAEFTEETECPKSNKINAVCLN